MQCQGSLKPMCSCCQGSNEPWETGVMVNRFLGIKVAGNLETEVPGSIGVEVP